MEWQESYSPGALAMSSGDERNRTFQTKVHHFDLKRFESGVSIWLE